MPANDSRSIVDNDAFVVLMATALEDQELCTSLIAILRQPAFQRRSALNTFLHEMRLKGAPKSFQAAIACLLDEEVAARCLEILSQ